MESAKNLLFAILPFWKKRGDQRPKPEGGEGQCRHEEKWVKPEPEPLKWPQLTRASNITRGPAGEKKTNMSEKTNETNEIGDSAKVNADTSAVVK